MKPYLQGDKLKYNNKDYHLHKKNKKLLNWWEGITNYISRRTLKQKLQRE
jgi:hypothetical protein